MQELNSNALKQVEEVKNDCMNRTDKAKSVRDQMENNLRILEKTVQENLQLLQQAKADSIAGVQSLESKINTKIEDMTLQLFEENKKILLEVEELRVLTGSQLNKIEEDVYQNSVDFRFKIVSNTSDVEEKLVKVTSEQISEVEEKIEDLKDNIDILVNRIEKDMEEISKSIRMLGI